MKDSDFRKLYRLNWVPRWAVIPTVQTQTVSQHVYNSLWLGYWIEKTLDLPMMDGAMCLAILRHDEEEGVTGDHPSTAKTPKPLSEYTENQLFMKLVDYAEAALFCNTEQAFGNRSINPVYVQILERMEKVYESLVLFEDTMSFQRFFEELMTNFDTSLHPSMEPRVEEETEEIPF